MSSSYTRLVKMSSSGNALLTFRRFALLKWEIKRKRDRNLYFMRF